MKLKYIFIATALLSMLASYASDNLPASIRQSASSLSLPPFDEDSVTVIKEQPEGELKYYTRAGFTVDMSDDGPKISNQENKLIAVVFGKNNEIWIKNPISNDMRESWVKGTLQQDNKTISVATGQFTDYMPSLIFGRQLWVLDFNSETNTYSVNPDITEIKYTLSDDKIELEGTSQQRIIGSIFRAKGKTEEEHHYEGTWSGYGNYGCLYTLSADQPIVTPSFASHEKITFRAPVNYENRWNLNVLEATLSTDSDDVYLSGFCSAGLGLFLNNDWTIKGRKENGQLIFPSGQFVGTNNDNAYYVTSTLANISEATNLIFSATEDGGWESDNMILFTQSKKPESPLYYYDGATLSNQELPALVTPPASARPHLYKMSYKGYIQAIDFYYDSNSNVTVAAADNKIYIKGLTARVPDSWIEGDIVGDKVIFKSPQFLGSDYQNPEVWFMAFGSDFAKPLSSVEFNYDKVSGALSDASANIAVSICQRRNLGLAWYFNPSLEILEVNPATPANPTDLKWTTYDWYPCPSFSFKIPTEDVNGEALYSNWLYYRIYTMKNGTVSQFQMLPADYPDMNLSEPLSLFPYNFSGYDISWTNGHHDINIRGDITDLSRIGVQSLYNAGDEEHTSDIIWLDVVSTGINDVLDNDSKDDILYNLLGQRVYGKPNPGIYIRNGKKIVIH